MTNPTGINYIALVLDNKIEQILAFDDRLTSIILSNPLIVDITASDGSPTQEFGATYDPVTKTFTPPTPSSDQIPNP
jgi:hypothetical protein